MFKTIEEKSVAELIEKKSKFIATILPVANKAEAEEKLKETKNYYKDARHNCFAYIVEKLERCSDDGEPSGTAGLPILEILRGKELNNVLVVVTRYFGGILLGTGGLVRAYSDVTKKAIESAKIVTKEYGIRYKVEVSYGELKNIQYLCKKLDINIIKMEYDVNIILTLESTKLKKEKFDEQLKTCINEEICEENIII